MSRRRSKYNSVFSSNNYTLNLCCHLINWFSHVIYLHDFHVYSSLLYCITRNVPLIRLYCDIFFEWITSTWKNHTKFIGLCFMRFHSYTTFSPFSSPSPLLLFLCYFSSFCRYFSFCSLLSRFCSTVGSVQVA